MELGAKTLIILKVDKVEKLATFVLELRIGSMFHNLSL